MVQATTPTFILTVPNTVDLSSAAHVYFTMTQKELIITKSGSQLTVSSHQVQVYLTQAETLQFKPGQAVIQLNWTYSTGQRACTKKVTINVEDNLLKKVVL